MTHDRLDATLQTGDYVPMFLAAWLLEVARNPAAVRARIVDSEPGHLIELQNATTGVASGGLVYCAEGFTSPRQSTLVNLRKRRSAASLTCKRLSPS